MLGDENLKECFSNLDTRLVSQKEIENFMLNLLQNYVFVVSGKEFVFAEIEAYFTSSDKNTFKRVSQAGEIFFHNFGFDISFESSLESSGGILVRSLEELKSAKFITGPRKCMSEILNLKTQSLNFSLRHAANIQKAAGFTERIRKHSQTEPPNEPRRLISTALEKYLLKDGKEAREYKKSLSRYLA